jgi:hypothetical protein
MNFSKADNENSIIYQRAFNKHFFEFLDEIILIFPENKDIIAAKVYFENFKKMNPSIIIKSWVKFIYLPYSDIINNDNIMYFFFKEYDEDLSHLKNKNEILSAIEKLKKPLQELNEENLNKIKQYIKNLNNLSIHFSA